MAAGSDHAVVFTASLEVELAGRVRRVAVGLLVLGLVTGGLALLEWPRVALLGVAFALGATQIAGY